MESIQRDVVSRTLSDKATLLGQTLLKIGKDILKSDVKRGLLTSTILTVVAFHLARRADRRKRRASDESHKKLSARDRQLVAYEMLPQSNSIRVRSIALILLTVIQPLKDYLMDQIRGKQGYLLVPEFLAGLRKIPFPTIRTFQSIAVWLSCLVGQKHQAWPYLIAYLVPVELFFAARYGLFYHMFFALFVLAPLLELFTGVDRSNPTQEEAEELNNRKTFRVIPMIWAPLQLLLITWGCWAAKNYPFTIPQLLGITGSIGVICGVLGINISHELIHKPTTIEPLLGKILLSSVCYGHWYTEHIYGHHRRVSTPSDPATSRRGENFYAFWVRSVVGSFLSAIELEKERAHKKRLSFWNLSNNMLQMGALTTLMALTVRKLFGPRGLFVFLGQSFVAFSLLEVVNYIEHYGLEREQIEDGDKTKYEKVDVMHSWNADSRFTNMILFKLQRHSDHHAYATRRYQILRSFPHSPQMPTGYAGMITLALFPPLWFAIMNPRLDAFRKQPKIKVESNAVTETEKAEERENAE